MIRLASTEWTDGKIVTYGTTQHVRAEAAGVGPVTLVYEIGRDSYRFRGVERIVANPRSEFAGDLSPITQHLGSDSVARAVWTRLYREDQTRRAYHD